MALISYGLAVALALGSGIGFAINDAIAKLKVKGNNSMSLTFISLLFGLPIIMISLLFPVGRFTMTLKAFIVYIFAGLVNFTIGRTSLYASISRLSSSGGSILSSTSALFGFIMGWLILNEHVTYIMAIGVILIMISVYIASGGFKSEISLSGILFGLITGLSIAIAVILIKIGDQSGGQPVLGTLIAYLSGLSFSFIGFKRNPISKKEIKDLLIPLLLMSNSAAAGQVMRYIALLTAEASVVAPLQNIRPVVATFILLAFGVGEKRPKKYHWIAAILASIGAALVSIK
ncbi:EamA-like transporter family [Caldisphaera lagunensis DSM 15908]|uniref:EamA-like transporter family n=1 Tax=Caldisphaera lagunensis (strain DSM 15908 / JCM 11604 / ANMR 0165 / IC-154) TaxID=1056495 RepID=L0AAB8_CALLD|nr:DMT family transporter [Caldisphaera lagunensis]AFZ70369.1 EamA-like transporter family [Caldisphaera lagunensis DSM 15908]